MVVICKVLQHDIAKLLLCLQDEMIQAFGFYGLDEKLNVALRRKATSISQPFQMCAQFCTLPLDIIDNYKNRMYILDNLLNFEVNVETVFERDIHSMTR